MFVKNTPQIPMVATKDKKIDKDTKILTKFIELYCKHKHFDIDKSTWNSQNNIGKAKDQDLFLCHDCASLLDYSAKRRMLCPLDLKPTCKKCEIHCYSSENRQKIREVMRFSGMQMIKRGRIDMIYHYFF